MAEPLLPVHGFLLVPLRTLSDTRCTTPIRPSSVLCALARQQHVSLPSTQAMCRSVATTCLLRQDVWPRPLMSVLFRIPDSEEHRHEWTRPHILTQEIGRAHV